MGRKKSGDAARVETHLLELALCRGGLSLLSLWPSPGWPITSTALWAPSPLWTLEEGVEGGGWDTNSLGKRRLTCPKAFPTPFGQLESLFHSQELLVGSAMSCPLCPQHPSWPGPEHRLGVAGWERSEWMNVPFSPSRSFYVCVSLSLCVSASFSVCLSLSPAGFYTFLSASFSASQGFTPMGPEALRSLGLHQVVYPEQNWLPELTFQAPE